VQGGSLKTASLGRNCPRNNSLEKQYSPKVRITMENKGGGKESPKEEYQKNHFILPGAAHRYTLGPRGEGGPKGRRSNYRISYLAIKSSCKKNVKDVATF